MTIRGIKLVSVPVSDQDRAKDFFAKNLGFEVRQDMSMGPMRWLEVGPAGSATTLALLSGLPGMEPGGVMGIQLLTDDLDGDCDSLRSAGVSVDGPNARPWGRDATFKDPDGNGFVLMSAPGGK